MMSAWTAVHKGRKDSQDIPGAERWGTAGGVWVKNDDTSETVTVKKAAVWSGRAEGEISKRNKSMPFKPLKFGKG